MSPRHGIVVHPGAAIDFSALARPIPRPSNLLARATSTGTTIGGIIFIIVLVLIVIGIIFAAVVLILIWKNKAQRRKRQRQMEATKPAARHEYRVLEDTESGNGGLHELPQDNQVGDPVPYQTVELQADVNEVPRVQQLDGYTAPPKPNNQPTELPSEAHVVVRDTYR
ncbi:hypothetical protein BU26DRAFT_157778 [Trematosphaeria pertusa]|uniref:Uncharacterized protein n=1 Tax=Trematosphaeria pertusa TaxID=390896 RepID=A0A6A6HWH2_9PLEO|nr:uncharacterized protein BU26DRAFT_157778 [Trematosphaeria pertusa]KAF2242269.1 hypothetical protein BU26DRAFT_157778 [Trematosphaeria pertusa]